MLWAQLFNAVNYEFLPAFILPVIKDLFHGPFGKHYFFFCRQIQNKAPISKPSLAPLLSVGCAETGGGGCDATVNVVILQGFCLEFYSITHQPYWI